jgi:hypothetical protein
MNRFEPPSNAGPTPEPTPPAKADPPPAPPIPAAAAKRHAPLWLLTLGAGIVVAALSGIVGEATYNGFPVRIVDRNGKLVVQTSDKPAVISFPVIKQLPDNFDSMDGYVRTGVRAMLTGQGERIAERYRASTMFGALGGLLGLGLGLIGRLACGGPRSAWIGAAVGGIGGVLAGVVLSWALVPLFFQLQDSASQAEYKNPDAPSRLLLFLFLTHAGICAGVGAFAGLGLGLGLGDRKRVLVALIAGMFGGCVGAFAFDTVNSLLFPLMRTFTPIPDERVARLVAQLCVSVATAFIAGLAAAEPRRGSTASQQAAG